MLCQKPGCSAEAAYVAPNHWCDYHWAEWWVEGELEGVEMTPEQKDKAVRLLAAAIAGDGDIDNRLMDLYDEHIYRITGRTLVGPPTRDGDWSVEPA